MIRYLFLYLANKTSEFRHGLQENNVFFYIHIHSVDWAVEMVHNLLDVNEDCLIKIFTNLTVPELADVASTCTRFQTIARDVFSFRLKSNTLDIDMECCQPSHAEDLAHRRQTAAILRNFGDMLTKLKITFVSMGREKFHNTCVFNAMVNYCTGELDRLELRNCKYLDRDEVKVIDARELFRNVKDLVLDVSFAVNSSFLSDAKQLTRISLQWISPMNVVKYLSNDYPQLQSLTLKFFGTSQIDINAFLKRHRNLIEMELHGGQGYDFSSFYEYCSMLSKLTIWNCRDSDILPIANLDKLTAFKLSIGYGGQSPINLLKTSKSSETVEELVLLYSRRLLNDDAMDLMTAFARFTNLKHLSFIFSENTTDDLLAVLHHLTKLQVLSIGGPHRSVTGNGLVDMVGHLPDLRQLTMHPGYSDTRIQLKKSTYLQISKICRTRNKKLVIYNFDTKNSEQMKGEEPFAEGNRQEFVQYIALDFSFGEYEQIVQI